jgi:hypothetical protein
VKKILTYAKNRKGITIVMIALMLFLLLALLGMAVDISYMYFAKNQLQVAADASALAGASNIDRYIDDTVLFPNALLQETARQTAWKFACRNRSGNQPVFLVTNSSVDCNAPPSGNALNGTNNANGDIIVGHWQPTCPTGFICSPGQICEPAGSGFFCRATGSTRLEINALKATAKRTGETPGMPALRVFVGQIFRFMGPGTGWAFMTARASAIAKGGLQVLPITLCINQCGADTDFNNPNCPGKKFIANPPNNSVPCAISGANVPPDSNVNSNDLKNFFDNPFAIDLCDKCVNTSQGQLTPPVLRAIDDAKSRLGNQEIIRHINPSNPSENWTATVQGWRVLIPILTINNPKCGASCAGDCPGDQNAQCRYDVPFMAEVIITKIDAPPGPADGCPNCYGNWKGLTLIGTTTTPSPKVTRISCLTCSEASDLVGSRVKLVK